MALMGHITYIRKTKYEIEADTDLRPRVGHQPSLRIMVLNLNVILAW
jgi:hypothetical protein